LKDILIELAGAALFASACFATYYYRKHRPRVRGFDEMELVGTAAGFEVRVVRSHDKGEILVGLAWEKDVGDEAVTQSAVLAAGEARQLAAWLRSAAAYKSTMRAA